MDAFVPLSLRGATSNTLGGAANQSWTLDSQGNWSSYTSNGVTQTQTANAQNQITSVSGTSATPAYDANGNMISASLTSQPAASDTLTYDAWNRLVKVTNSSGQIIAQYTYNAMGYRVTESYPQGGTGIPAGETNYTYYDSQWQSIETRTNGTASSNVTSQTVWSAAYTNAAILQDTYTGGVIQPGSRIYFLQDANWNTTAIVGYNSTTGTWGVTQRYVYSPYGTITVLNAGWSTASSQQPTVDNLYQGMTLDPVTGLYYARNRNYDPSLGRWINQDPAGYINGANTYQFVMGNPVGNLDPWGLATMAQTLAGGPITGVPFGQLMYAYDNLLQWLSNLGKQSPIGAGTCLNAGPVCVGMDVGAGKGIEGTVSVTKGPVTATTTTQIPGGQTSTTVGANYPGGVSVTPGGTATVTIPVSDTGVDVTVSANGPMIVTGICNNPPGYVTDANGDLQVVPP